MTRDTRLRAVVLALLWPCLVLAQNPEVPVPPAPTETPVAQVAEGSPETVTEQQSEPPSRMAAALNPLPPPKSRVIAGLKGDVLGGGWIAATLLSASANMIVRDIRGEDPGDAAEHAVADMKRPEFLVGNLVCGSLGAALGAALPIPALARAPLFVRALGTAAAPLALAAVASTVGTTAIALARRHQLTWTNLMHSVDWTNLAAQTAGSLVGMSLGTTLVGMGLAPALALGSVAIVPLIGGVLGSIAGAELVHLLRKHYMDPAKGAAAANPASATAPDALPKDAGTNGNSLLNVASETSGSTSAAAVNVQPPSANVVSNVAVADPFADLPKTEILPR